jgi:hypothetical protein
VGGQEGEERREQRMLESWCLMCLCVCVVCWYWCVCVCACVLVFGSCGSASPDDDVRTLQLGLCVASCHGLLFFVVGFLPLLQSREGEEN